MVRGLAKLGDLGEWAGGGEQLHRGLSLGFIFSAIVLDCCMNKQYYANMKTLTPTRQWIIACAERLHERWHTVEATQLEEVAMDIWQDERLRTMEPGEAAAVWLLPVASAR